MNQFPQVLELISDLELDQIQLLLTRARKIKEGYLTQSLIPSQHHKKQTVITYFSENSTRTKISFIQAITNLGLRHINFDVHLSSVHKGENLKETLMTLKHLGTSLLIYRTKEVNELHPFKEDPPFPMINAGDGSNQHPTQALLDLFTMIENGNNPKGKTITIVGDCLHSRVCHSLVELMNLWGARVILCGPKDLIQEDLIAGKYEITTDLRQAMNESDILYPLRLQVERHNTKNEGSFEQKYNDQYGITLNRLTEINKKVPVYHAGPANIGVEIDQDVIDSPFYMGYHQVSHSIPMRTAIIKTLIQGSTNYGF